MGLTLFILITMILQNELYIFTDGSCHTQHGIGAWVAIIVIAGQKIILSDTVFNTTHQQMELLAVIKALENIIRQELAQVSINLVTDSQYVTGLPPREVKLMEQKFITKKGGPIANTHLVKTLLQLLRVVPVKLIKIKAHQKQTAATNYNIEADKLSRYLVRQAVTKFLNQ